MESIAEVHRRQSIRLKGYDYTQVGLYFVTIVTQDRLPLLGQIVNGDMQLNRFGEVVREEWERITVVRPKVELGAFVVMPNHIHGILWFKNDHVYTAGATRPPKEPGAGGSPLQERCRPVL